jgi:hypothetical protein
MRFLKIIAATIWVVLIKAWGYKEIVLLWISITKCFNVCRVSWKIKNNLFLISRNLISKKIGSIHNKRNKWLIFYIKYLPTSKLYCKSSINQNGIEKENLLPLKYLLFQWPTVNRSTITLSLWKNRLFIKIFRIKSVSKSWKSKLA